MHFLRGRHFLHRNDSNDNRAATCGCPCQGGRRRGHVDDISFMVGSMRGLVLSG